MVQKTFNIFNISAVSSTLFVNIGKLEFNIFNISAVSSAFFHNMLETTEM